MTVSRLLPCLGSSLALLATATLGLSGCDLDAEPDTFEAEQVETPTLELDGPVADELSAADVPWPAIDPESPASYQSPLPKQKFGFWTIETFVFDSDDFRSITTAPDVLFANFPAAMEPMPPELSTSFMLSFEFRNDDDEIIGFGSEQEVLDFETLTGETTYTLTIPGRGTIVFGQEEDFAWLIDEVDQMVADGEPIRSFDPPLVELSTIPGTGRIIGGTGEFAHAFGFALEYGIVNQINLITRQHELGTVLQVAYF